MLTECRRVRAIDIRAVGICHKSAAVCCPVRRRARSLHRLGAIKIIPECLLLQFGGLAYAIDSFEGNAKR